MRAEQVGLAIDEIVGLQSLIEREAQKDPTISRIIVVSPLGQPLVQSGAEGLPDEDRAAVLRRVFSVQEQESAIDRGTWIYSGRTLLDSSGVVMGAVILMGPTDVTQAATAVLQENLISNYGLMFGRGAATLIPLIVYLFRDVGSIFGLLGTAPTRGRVEQEYVGEAGELASSLGIGNALFEQAEAELDAIQRGVK